MDEIDFTIHSCYLVIDTVICHLKIKRTKNKRYKINSDINSNYTLDKEMAVWAYESKMVAESE